MKSKSLFTMLKLGSAGLALAALLALQTAPAQAGMATISGALATTDIYSADATNTGCVILAGYAEYNDVHPFYVTAAGTYTFTDNFNTLDVFFEIVGPGGFDPTNVTANCIAAQGNPSASASLSADTQYYLVVYANVSLNTGPYEVGVSGPGNIVLGSLAVAATGEACSINDGRINPDSCAGPVALYCGDDGLEVWDIDADGVGSLAFTYNGSFDVPAANTLLMSSGDIQLWILDSGEFQVNADQGEGKVYAFLFNGCPYDGGGYNANIDPNE